MSYNRIDSLLTNETGVLPGSQYYISADEMSSREMFQYLKTCGHYFCNRNYAVRRDYYQFLLVAYVISGEMLLEYGGKHYAVEPGAVVCIDCQNPHCYTTDTELEFVWMHVDGNMSRQLCKGVNRLGGPIIRNDQCAYIRDQILEVIGAYRQKAPLDLYVRSALIYDVMCRLFIGLPGKQRPGENKLVMTAIEYMRYNLINDITVADIAAALSAEPEGFVRSFRKITGYEPLDYLVQLRVGLAQHLLVTTEDPLNQVALAVGFADTAGMEAIFLEKVGDTPEEYRREHKPPLKKHIRP